MFVPEVPSSQISEERGRMITPVFQQNTDPRCLKFYYFMNGINDAGTLNAYILLRGGTLPMTPHWTSDSNMGNVWNLGNMDIPAQGDDFQVNHIPIHVPVIICNATTNQR